MKGRHKHFRNHKTVLTAIVLAFVVVILFCKLEDVNAQACILPDKTAWVPLQVLRPVIQLTARQTLPVYLYEDSRLLQNLLQIGASAQSLLCVVARAIRAVVCEP